MLVEGVCENGHPLVCDMRGGRVAGAVVGHRWRRTCPQCGADVAVEPESGTLLVGRASGDEPPESRKLERTKTESSEDE